jgi:hypothetical protein
MYLVGRKYGTRTVLSRSRLHKAKWRVRCECGAEAELTLANLKVRKCTKCDRVYGEGSRNWKGGRYEDKDGYVQVRNPSHPRAWGSGYVYEHTMVMEEHLHRYLLPGETIHHINGVKNDNRLENLELWSAYHPSGQRVKDLVRWAKDLLARYEPEALK